MFWMPDQVRHDEPGTSYEVIKFEVLSYQLSAISKNSSA